MFLWLGISNSLKWPWLDVVLFITWLNCFVWLDLAFNLNTESFSPIHQINYWSVNQQFTWIYRIKTWPFTQISQCDWKIFWSHTKMHAPLSVWPHNYKLCTCMSNFAVIMCAEKPVWWLLSWYRLFYTSTWVYLSNNIFMLHVEFYIIKFMANNR